MMRASLYPYTVSFNKSASFPVKENVPGFATADGDFPTGLEFGVVGPSSSRKVLVRIVLAGWSTKQLISYNSTTIVSAPEY